MKRKGERGTGAEIKVLSTMLYRNVSQNSTDVQRRSF